MSASGTSPLPRKGLTEALPAQNRPSLSHMLTLPTELDLEIIQLIINTAEPGILALRASNAYFRSLISPSDLHKHALYLIQKKQSKAAERILTALEIHDQLPCSLCLCLLPVERFHHNCRHGKWVLGGQKAHTRFCMDCGIKHRIFRPGNSIKVDNKGDNYKTVCSYCFEFLDEPEGRASCRRHYRAAINVRRRLQATQPF